MYSEELQRSHAPSEPCELPRSALTQRVKGDRMKKNLFIKRLSMQKAVNCRFQGYWTEVMRNCRNNARRSAIGRAASSNAARYCAASGGAGGMATRSGS